MTGMIAQGRCAGVEGVVRGGGETQGRRYFALVPGRGWGDGATSGFDPPVAHRKNQIDELHSVFRRGLRPSKLMLLLMYGVLGACHYGTALHARTVVEHTVYTGAGVISLYLLFIIYIYII